MVALQVGLPDLVGLALGEADVVTELLAFTANVAGVCHSFFQKLTKQS